MADDIDIFYSEDENKHPLDDLLEDPGPGEKNPEVKKSGSDGISKNKVPPNPGTGKNPQTKEADTTMSPNLTEMFTSAFENISGISGFVAAGVYDGHGQILSDRSSSDFNFKEVGGQAIELYRAAKSISDKMGLGVCNFVETHTDKYIFIHMCIVPGKGAMGVLLTRDGNIGLTRHQMEKEGRRLAPEFT